MDDMPMSPLTPALTMRSARGDEEERAAKGFSLNGALDWLGDRMGDAGDVIDILDGDDEDTDTDTREDAQEPDDPTPPGRPAAPGMSTGVMAAVGAAVAAGVLLLASKR